jgi:small redox-active disulfide protein 2
VEVKVLGVGCAKCKQLYEAAGKAIAQAGIAATLVKVEKIDEIKVYRVLSMPALVINEKVRAAGRIPETREIVAWLMTATQEEEESTKEA